MSAQVTPGTRVGAASPLSSWINVGTVAGAEAPNEDVLERNEKADESPAQVSRLIATALRIGASSGSAPAARIMG